jgi:hypothetical protein
MEYFHSCFGLISLAAFISLYLQYHGLYGPNGLQPIDNFVTWVSQHHLPSAAVSLPFYEKFYHVPSLLVYAHDLNVRYDIFGEFLLILGMISSSLISVGFHSFFLFLISWVCYLSLFIFGQAFLNFQWDMLLLEVGFLAIFTSFFVLQKRMMKSIHWCYRFLVWKLMFMAGVVKLQSNCPTWLSLTALEVISSPLETLTYSVVSLCHTRLTDCGGMVFSSIPSTLLTHWGDLCFTCGSSSHLPLAFTFSIHSSSWCCRPSISSDLHHVDREL